MSLHHLDLRPVAGITPADKPRWPVSIAVLPDGQPLVVSRWADDIWDWYPYITQENKSEHMKRIDWRIALPDGRLLTDPEHAGLLEATKDFIWSLFVEPVEGRKRLLMQTLIRRVDLLKLLLRWMVANCVTRFADLAGRTLDYVPTAKHDSNGKPLAKSTAALYLQILEDLYHQRGKIRDALHTHPWPDETAISLAGLKKGGVHRKPKTEIIPDTIAASLAAVALDYVQARSPSILAAMQSVQAVVQAKRDDGCVDNTLSMTRTRTARTVGYDGSTSLTADVVRLRTACYIVIDLFSGIRDSEVMSLAENCIVPGRAADDSVDVLWLHGTIYKTGLRPKRWLVPPVVESAVTVLTKLFAPLREQLHKEEAELVARIGSAIAKERARLVKRLHTVRAHKNKLFLTTVGNRGDGINVLSGFTMRVALRDFCADHGILGPDGRPYPLHAHQFRRTYAHFIARSELGDLLVLRDHFGHWSIDMTTYYADGGSDEYESDAELLEMIGAEKGMRQTKIMTGYLDSDAPLANGNHWLSDWRASVRTAANKEELIREYADTITLNGTGHSWCIGNAKGTGCGGLCVFEAQLCVDCNYGIIGQEHRPVWEGIRDQQREALAFDDMGPGGRARAKQIHDYAEKVLRRLDGQEAA